MGPRRQTRDPAPAYVHLLRAKDMIDRCYAEPLDVTALAQEARASPAHFARTFKRAFGETPHQYLQRRRIERAQDLLRATGLAVTRVALEVGFQSLSSFTRAFRTLVGETPGAYAARWRAKDAPPIPGCYAQMFTRPMRQSHDAESGWSAR